MLEHEIETNPDILQRLVEAWVETAERHARNEEYYHQQRDLLLRLMREMYFADTDFVIHYFPGFNQAILVLDYGDRR